MVACLSLLRYFYYTFLQLKLSPLHFDFVLFAVEFVTDAVKLATLQLEFVMFACKFVMAAIN